MTFEWKDPSVVSVSLITEGLAIVVTEYLKRWDDKLVVGRPSFMTIPKREGGHDLQVLVSVRPK